MRKFYLTFRLLLMAAKSARYLATQSITTSGRSINTRSGVFGCPTCANLEAFWMYRTAVSLSFSRLSIAAGLVPGVPVGESPVNDDVLLSGLLKVGSYRACFAKHLCNNDSVRSSTYSRFRSCSRPGWRVSLLPTQLLHVLWSVVE